MIFRFCIAIIVVFVLNGCATYHNQFDDLSENNVGTEKKQLLHTFYLIGDLGSNNLIDSSATLDSFRLELDKASENSYAVFLGNNVNYDKIDSKKLNFNKQAKDQLNLQINLLKNYKGRSVFIPGNKDWDAGLNGLKEQEKYVNKKLNTDSFFPMDGCPIVNENVNDKLAVIVLDAQWYITDWNKHPKMNDDCSIKTREAFFEELESEIKQAVGKTTVIIVHHPLFSNGPRGGQYSFKSHMLPLPVLGSVKNAIKRTSGFSDASIQHKYYNEFNKRLFAITQQNKKTIIVSAHENSLQHIERDGLHQIISGSGSHISPARNTNGGKFAYATPGYTRLNVYQDGSSTVHFYSTEEKKTVYETEIFPPDKHLPNVKFNRQLPAFTEASIYPEEMTSKKSFYKFLMGDRYRELYGTLVEAPTVYLDTLFGGLKPIRKGGGHQSKSLRLKDENGRQYVMRALKKDAVLYMQSVLYKDQYVKDFYDNTEASEFIQDIFTGSHPYAPFVIGDLSAAADIYYLNSNLYFVPKQAALDKYNNEFGDELYMIEEHASEGHSDKANFGYSDKIISSIELFEEIHDDENKLVDERSYIRARLFDMLIGDWDRHQDQWRWIEFDENGKKVYRPMPRDRDQAFSIMSDGFLLGSSVSLMPLVAGGLRKYDGELKDLEGPNKSAKAMDIALISASEKQVWTEEAKHLQTTITDEVIDAAFKNIPVEVSNEASEWIKKMLISRRNNLQIISDNYYAILNKNVIITATNKDDYIEVTARENGTVTVKISRIKNDTYEDLFFERTFSPDLTKEIWIYGLDDEDIFKVIGKSRNIKIRLIGGQNNDVYEANKAKKVIIYDHKSMKNTITDVHRTKINLTDTYDLNTYDKNKYKITTNQLLPAIGFNPDDGFLIRINYLNTSKGIIRNPFSSQNNINAAYYFATNGFEASYTGEFATGKKNWNFNVTSRITSGNYTENFFGFGNSTPNYEVDGLVDKNFNRVKIQYMNVMPSFKRLGHLGSEFVLGINAESIEVDRTEGRILDSISNPNDPVFERNNFIGLTASHHYRNHDKSPYPSLGFETLIVARYINNLEGNVGFGYIAPSMELVHKISDNGKLVLSTTLGGRFTLGDDFEFYQAATIGAENGLRGYRRQRFSGKHSFYQTTDLRYKFNTIKTNLAPFHFGLYAGFDYGRIWVDDNLVLQEGFNNDRLNTSYGGGFWITGVNKLTAGLGLFYSDDGPQVTFALGFDFF